MWLLLGREWLSLGFIPVKGALWFLQVPPASGFSPRQGANGGSEGKGVEYISVIPRNGFPGNWNIFIRSRERGLPGQPRGAAVPRLSSSEVTEANMLWMSLGCVLPELRLFPGLRLSGIKRI